MATLRPSDLTACPRAALWTRRGLPFLGLYPGYHPGEFLAEEMEARGWTDLGVACRCLNRGAMLTELEVRHIRLGNIYITPYIATALWLAFGIRPYMWLAMEAGRWKAGI